MVKTYYFLKNRNNDLIGGHDYGSMEAAKAAIPGCNIPDAEVFVLPMKFLNDVFIHPENYCRSKTEQDRIRRLIG